MSVTTTCTTEYCSCCFKTVSSSCRHTFLTRYLKVSYKFPSDILEGTRDKGTGYSSDISEETISEGVLGLVPGLGPGRRIQVFMFCIEVCIYYCLDGAAYALGRLNGDTW